MKRLHVSEGRWDSSLINRQAHKYNVKSTCEFFIRKNRDCYLMNSRNLSNRNLNTRRDTMKRSELWIMAALIMVIMIFSAVYAVGGTENDSYHRQEMTTLQDGGKLVLPKEMSAVKISTTQNGDGLIFEGKKGDICGKKIGITGSFDFTGGKVGRIAVDGLGDRGLKIFVDIYLDDNKDPVTSVSLNNQMGSKAWSSKGDKSVFVGDKNIKGKHKISFVIRDESDKKNNKDIQVDLRSIEFALSTLPTLSFNIDESQGSISAMNGDEQHQTECYGNVDIRIPDGYKSEYTNDKISDMNLEMEYIRGRGNSTWSADKKPYKVKLDKKTDLFGMGENKHWVLLANRFDNSFMRNKMTYWLGEKLGMEFTPRSIPVEVIMNGEFYGTYFLTEQIRVDKNRVEIDDLEDKDARNITGGPELTGGYLLSMDPDAEESFITKNEMLIALENPSFEEYKNQAQLNYIKSYVQQTENAIFGEGFKDAHGRSYKDYMDFSSAVDYFWIQELSINGDAYGNGSTYLYKKRNGKLYWGPLWDFDYVAWGDLQYESNEVGGLDNTSTPWFQRLRNDTEFTKSLISRWKTIKSYLDQVTKKGGLLDQYYEQLRISRSYDEEKWGTYVEALDEEETEGKRYTYEEEVEQLRSWIKERTEWIDSNIEELKAKVYKIKFKVGKKVINTKTIIPDQKLGKLPKIPRKKNYCKVGWQDITGNIYTSNHTVDESMTLRPGYVRKDRAVRAKKIYLSTYNMVMTTDQDVETISCTVMPLDSLNNNVRWKSSDKKVVKVNRDGDVRAVGEGRAKVTAYIKNGPKAVCEVRVTNDESLADAVPDNMVMSKKKVTLDHDGYTQLKIRTMPKNTEIPSMSWISTDSKVVEVDENGVVSAKKKGKAYIIATCEESGSALVCAVVVKDKRIKIKTNINSKKKCAVVKFKKIGKKDYNKVMYRSSSSIKWKAKTVRKGRKCLLKKLKKNGTYEVKVEQYKKVKGRFKKKTESKVHAVMMTRAKVKAKAARNSIVLNCAKAGKAQGFEIRYSLKKNMKNAKAETAEGSPVRNHTLSGLRKGKRYYIQTRPLWTDGYEMYKGQYSKIVSVKVK